MFEDEQKARMGVKECYEHNVVQPYELLWEKEGEFVAQFKALVLLMPNGNVKVTSGFFDPAVIKSEKELDAELKQLLQTSVTSKNKKKKKKPAAKKAAEE